MPELADLLERETAKVHPPSTDAALARLRRRRDRRRTARRLGAVGLVVTVAVAGAAVATGELRSSGRRPAGERPLDERGRIVDVEGRFRNVVCVSFHSRPQGWCATGVLIGPTTVLTSAYVALEAKVDDPLSVTAATSVPLDADPDGMVAVVGTALNPTFRAPAWTPYGDRRPLVPGRPGFDAGRALGVLYLERPILGVRPASLPAAGLLDRLTSAAGSLRDVPFVRVGYGVDVDGRGDAVWTTQRRRYWAVQAVQAVRRELTTDVLDPAHRIHPGDDGSPVFLADGDVLVAIGAARLDTRDARRFLGRVVLLP